MTEEQRVRGLHCNRWFVFWALQHRLGVVPATALRHVADDFMKHPQNAEFWGRARDTRAREIRDRTDRRFIEIFDAAYGARHLDPDESYDLVGAGA